MESRFNIEHDLQRLGQPLSKRKILTRDLAFVERLIRNHSRNSAQLSRQAAKLRKQLACLDQRETP
jgi:hypothetical protein